MKVLHFCFTNCVQSNVRLPFSNFGVCEIGISLSLGAAAYTPRPGIRGHTPGGARRRISPIYQRLESIYCVEHSFLYKDRLLVYIIVMEP